MVQYGYKTISVKRHRRTYYIKTASGSYRPVKKWIKQHPRKIKTSMKITQKANVKNKVPYISITMTKEIPQNLIDGVRKLTKDQEHEFSIDIDFERKDEIPQQMLIMKGGKRSTLKIGDFELFGHTHPGHTYPYPSNTDLRILLPLRPEFIIAGKSGKTIIMNIENYDKWQKWKNSGTNIRPNLVDTTWGRDKIYEQTGVRVYPMMKKVKIELIDDPHYEKQFPRAPKPFVEKWHSKQK